MRKLLFCVALALGGLPLSGCHRGQVRLPQAPGSRHYEWRDRIDPLQFASPARALLYNVSVPLGYAAARQRPLQSYIANAKIRWNEAVQLLIDEFDRLGATHNDAAISVRQFEALHAQLVRAVEELGDHKRELTQALDDFLAHGKVFTQRSRYLTDAEKDTLATLRRDMVNARAHAEAVITRAVQRVESLRIETLRTEAAPLSANLADGAPPPDCPTCPRAGAVPPQPTIAQP